MSNTFTRKLISKALAINYFCNQQRTMDVAIEGFPLNLAEVYLHLQCVYGCMNLFVLVLHSKLCLHTMLPHNCKTFNARRTLYMRYETKQQCWHQCRCTALPKFYFCLVSSSNTFIFPPSISLYCDDHVVVACCSGYSRKYYFQIVTFGR